MPYSGKYIVTNKEKYRGNLSEIVYRSHWEKLCFMWCDSNPSIKEWSSEEIVVPYYYDVDKKYHRYFPDLKIKFTNGKTILVEIKPEKQTEPPKGQRRTKQYVSEGLTYIKNMKKWEAAESYCKDRGWEFQVWTEKTLQEMKIMKKEIKPLKPFPKNFRSTKEKR